MKIKLYQFLLLLAACCAGCSLSHNPDLPSIHSGDGDGILGDGDGDVGDGDVGDGDAGDGDAGDGDGDGDGGTGGVGTGGTPPTGGADSTALTGGQAGSPMGGFAGASLEEN